MAHYDAVVIGAGPAGGEAAFVLARGGAKVALLEKMPLPRHKTCGGGMPMMVSKVLAMEELRDLAPDAFVEADAKFMRHTWKFGDPCLAPMNPEPGDGCERSLWMVRRSVFDNALAQRAACAGAELRDGLGVRALEIERDGPVKITAEGPSGVWTATADAVIGADGANGITARAVGLRKERSLAIAMEAEVPHRWGEGHADLRPEVCHLEYGAVERGYAWVFPKGDHLNVGAGVFRPRRAGERGDTAVRELLQRAIVDYLTLLGVPKRVEELVFHAHPLPLWNGMDKIQSGRVLLAGDAAGLINPFFGDGILHALKSGQIAAQCVLSGETSGYTEAIAAEFRSNFDAALRMAAFFYRWPGFCYRHGIKRPGATRIAMRLFCGETPFNDISRRMMRLVREAAKSEPIEAKIL